MAWASFELTFDDEPLPTAPATLVAVLDLVVCEAALGTEAAGSAADAGAAAGEVALLPPWLRWRGGIVDCACCRGGGIGPEESVWWWLCAVRMRPDGCSVHHATRGSSGHPSKGRATERARCLRTPIAPALAPTRRHEKESARRSASSSRRGRIFTGLRPRSSLLAKLTSPDVSIAFPAFLSSSSIHSVHLPLHD